MSDHYVVGQRWISDAEPELGLGLVAEVDMRSVSILFPAAHKTRVYAQQSAPITRVRFAIGDEVTSRDNDVMIVKAVQEEQGLYTYEGVVVSSADDHLDKDVETQWPETSLNDFIQLTDTRTRLFSGQIEHDRWFELRLDAHHNATRAMQADTYGLAGCRINPVPHQLYLANEIASRYAPRALLADEVGLGKTIEAGLIVHKHLMLGLASRILVMVPDVLIHQWLVEWLRRFNLRFSIFDAEKVDALIEIAAEADDAANLFETEQLVLCPSSLFAEHATARELALDAPWDILVVDEAHHVQWSPGASSVLYDFLSILSDQVNGVLLLTATPEQLGEAGHFARLHLLDAERFADYDVFVEEHQTFKSLSDTVLEITQGQPLSEQAQAWLRECDLDERAARAADTSERVALARKLIDLHGTSRVFFRNTRDAIAGFPQRELRAQPLPMPDDVDADRLWTAWALLDDDAALPLDARVQSLLGLLRSESGKMLVIASRAELVIALEKHLRERHSVRCAVFHEHMSLVERDRAAAYFADPQSVARLLLCSEIGSEGRNFQFVQHIVLFDLPAHPDLLEQRIGRLDRIGQKDTIYIHVPYIEHTDQALLFRWYEEGMNAFRKTNAIGQAVYAAQQQELNDLLSALATGSSVDAGRQDAFIQRAAEIAKTARTQLAEGRDRLVEIASFDAAEGERLMEQVVVSDHENRLSTFLAKTYDALGISQDYKDACSIVIKPDAQAQLVDLPGLDEAGRTVTYDRQYALAHEDVDYFTWEHPFVRGVLDMLHTSHHGKCSVVSVKFPLLPEASLLVETHHVFAVNTQAYSELALYFSDVRHRVLLDKQHRDLTKLLTMDRFWVEKRSLEQSVARQICTSMRSRIESCLEKADDVARHALQSTIEIQAKQLDDYFAAELTRLSQLKKRFGNVHHGEIDTLTTRREACQKLISQTRVRLELVRLIVVTH